MTTSATRRLVLPPTEVAALCASLGLQLPPSFASQPAPIWTAGLLVDGLVHPSVAAGLAATCTPQLGVLVTTTVGGCEAAFGIRGDLGGSLLRTADSDVEMSTWPGLRFGDELRRAVPSLRDGPRPTLHVPLSELADAPALRGAVIGTLRATVVAPPSVLGDVTWLATSAGWLSLEPEASRRGVRWATVRPVAADDLGPAVAPLVAAGLP